jgi:hypothetical protein
MSGYQDVPVIGRPVIGLPLYSDGTVVLIFLFFSLTGQGIGKVLAKAAFDHCAEKDYKMKITCWYLDGYLKRHPEEKYMKLVVD